MNLEKRRLFRTVRLKVEELDKMEDGFMKQMELNQVTLEVLKLLIVMEDCEGNESLI